MINCHYTGTSNLLPYNSHSRASTSPGGQERDAKVRILVQDSDMKLYTHQNKEKQESGGCESDGREL